VLFIDVNVINDVLGKRRGWEHSLKILNSSKMGEYDYGISALTVFFLEGYLRNNKPIFSQIQIRQKIGEIVECIEILALDSDIISNALSSDFHDFEDAIQYQTAKKHDCSAIITRNIKDFTKAKGIEIWTPEDFHRSRM
jgi:predicted nucleic acid-binding protein